MQVRVTVRTEFPTTLERAFKTPMLCDLSKIHTGFGPLPRVTHCLDDEDWGRPGSTKRIVSGPSIAFRGGESSLDRVVERVENAAWKIEVGSFKAPVLGFEKFVGEWKTTERAPGRVAIEYTYTMHGRGLLLAPLQWLFTKVFWRLYMRQVLANVRRLAVAGEPYRHA